ncbi:S8 family serine peptidase [Pseudomonas aeruginosa]|uniref:S8 family serine peptidase n=1 Tax=Pseudomonas aeruginosa TaxID=287 RepID=UPI003364C9A8
MKRHALSWALTIVVSTMAASSTLAKDRCPTLTGREDTDVSRESAARCLPGDNPLQAQQWNLFNSGQDAFSASGGEAGNDLNLWWAHRTGVLGSGVNVAVVDDGLAIAHPDLAANIRPGSRNVVTGSSDPTPTNKELAHGTSVAGIIAAIDNRIGIKGVAPRVQLQGFNLLDPKSPQKQRDWLYALGDSEATQDNRVFNQSYGESVLKPSRANSLSQRQLDRLFKKMTLKADGGAAYIKAAGNGFKTVEVGEYSYRYQRRDAQRHLPFENSNLDPANNNFWNLVVSAINADGVRASYSSVGSNIFLAAPGGEFGTDSPAHVTTDLPGCEMGYNRSDEASENRLHNNPKLDPDCNYNGTMNGTSSATPNVAGTLALLMSAHPNLSVRDLRDILARSATRIDPHQRAAHLRYTSEAGPRQVTGLEGWERNAAGLWYNPSYGFGLVNVNHALKLAARHNSLPPLVRLPWREVELDEDNQLEIPDVGSAPTVSVVQIDRSLSVEAVQVKLNLDHQRLSDLLIELVSPAGTRSVLLNPYTSLVGQAVDRHVLGSTPVVGMRDFPMLSHKFYGEGSEGEWMLRVTDVSSGTRQIVRTDSDEQRTLITESNNTDPGILLGWSLRIFGH